MRTLLEGISDTSHHSKYRREKNAQDWSRRNTRTHPIRYHPTTPPNGKNLIYPPWDRHMRCSGELCFSRRFGRWETSWCLWANRALSPGYAPYRGNLWNRENHTCHRSTLKADWIEKFPYYAKYLDEYISYLSLFPSSFQHPENIFDKIEKII